MESTGISSSFLDPQMLASGAESSISKRKKACKMFAFHGRACPFIVIRGLYIAL